MVFCRNKMNQAHFWIAVTVLFSSAVLVAAQSSVRRCFQFTWLGPRFNNESVFLNATCQDATRLASGVPCEQPLVTSYDGTWPDVDYIWTHYGQEASCILADNDVCAQYTYHFNGIAENSTYMCTRAVDQQGHSISSGCFESRNGSASTRVCFCRSVPGGVPCNRSSLKTFASVLTILLALSLLVDRRTVNLINTL